MKNKIDKIINDLFSNSFPHFKEELLYLARDFTIIQNDILIKKNYGEKGSYEIRDKNIFLSNGTNHYDTYPYLSGLKGIIKTYWNIINTQTIINGNKRTGVNYLIIFICILFITLDKNFDFKKEYENIFNDFIVRLTDATRFIVIKKINFEETEKIIEKILLNDKKIINKLTLL